MFKEASAKSLGDKSLNRARNVAEILIDASFQQSGTLIWTLNSRALVIKTSTKKGP